jgi:hypothetical protein
MIHACVIIFTATKFFVAFWTAWIPPSMGKIKVNNQSFAGESQVLGTQRKYMLEGCGKMSLKN